MGSSDSRLEEAIARIDAANAEDPNRVELDGERLPKELLYGRRMSEQLEALEPAASEALRLAVRGQHLCRWKIPRDDFPRDRAGYKKWRTRLGLMHAELAGNIARDVGYDEETVQRVRDLVLKKRLRQDPEAQTLEDVACLVFLRYYLSAFAAEHEDGKVVRILQKTWGKMSERGRQAALGLELPERERELVERALG